MMISANNDRDCREILQARGVKALAYFEVPEIITLFNKKQNKRKDKN